LGFISRQREESKVFLKIVLPSFFHLFYLSATKLYSSSPPWVFVLNRVFLVAENSTVLNNFDFNEKSALFFCVRESIAFLGDLWLSMVS